MDELTLLRELDADTPAPEPRAMYAARSRLRYEIAREFAPYVGISYERVLGETSTIYQRFGEKPEATTVAAGIRLFF